MVENVDQRSLGYFPFVIGSLDRIHIRKAWWFVYTARELQGYELCGGGNEVGVIVSYRFSAIGFSSSPLLFVRPLNSLKTTRHIIAPT